MKIAARLDERTKLLASAIDGDDQVGAEQQILRSLISDIITAAR